MLRMFDIHKTASFALFALAPLFASPALAQDIDQSSQLNLFIGYYDIFDEPDGVDFRIEYRPARWVFMENLKPWAGIELTAQGSLWTGGGLLYDWKLQEQWHLTPSLGAGLYSEGGSDIDLDYPIQFRTQLEISYAFDDSSRLGAAISHMSNAGLGDSNPGTETIGLSWGTPLNKLF